MKHPPPPESLVFPPASVVEMVLDEERLVNTTGVGFEVPCLTPLASRFEPRPLRLRMKDPRLPV